MILGESQQNFASPKEALAHYGTKGMRWGIRKAREGTSTDASGKIEKHGLGNGYKELELKKQNKLSVDTSRGYLEAKPASGIKGTNGRKMHEEMVNALADLQKEYPAVRDMKIEVIPMSHMPGGMPLRVQRVGAAVIPMRAGEIRIAYNDRMRTPDPITAAQMQAAMPGLKYRGYTGRHEMGHALAISGGLFPPLQTAKGGQAKFSEVLVNKQKAEDNHKAAFEKHGLSFKEVSKLGTYASTRPSEAFAELYGHYSTPELRSQLSPEVQQKAQSLFDDLGGKKK